MRVFGISAVNVEGPSSYWLLKFSKWSRDVFFPARDCLQEFGIRTMENSSAGIDDDDSMSG